jgi:hypothetical protein
MEREYMRAFTYVAASLGKVEVEESLLRLQVEDFGVY